MTRVLQQDIEYVDVRSSPERHEPTNFYEKWLDQCSSLPTLGPFERSLAPFHHSLCETCQPRTGCVGHHVPLIVDIDRLNEAFLCSADALRRLYPGYSLIVSDDRRLTNLLTLPGLAIHPPDSQETGLEQVINVVFRQSPTLVGGKVAGSLVDDSIFRTCRLTWNVGTVFYSLNTTYWDWTEH